MENKIKAENAEKILLAVNSIPQWIEVNSKNKIIEAIKSSEELAKFEEASENNATLIKNIIINFFFRKCYKIRIGFY
jgi:hypothetical protein